MEDNFLCLHGFPCVYPQGGTTHILAHEWALYQVVIGKESSCRRQRFRSAALVGGYSDDITSYLSPCQIESVFIMAMEDGRENLGVKKHGWQLFRSLCLWLPLWLVAPN
eukprot:scaffold38018_cov17-Tisochrysis_lutea.AAC.1